MTEGEEEDEEEEAKKKNEKRIPIKVTGCIVAYRCFKRFFHIKVGLP